MGRTKKNAAAAPEAVREAREELAMGMDTPGAQEAAESIVGAQIIGPADEGELLGCQDEAELSEGVLIEYAVTAKHGLNLRKEPRLDAPIIAVLPCNVGVFGKSGPSEGGWRQVMTGRLSGWVVAGFLTVLEHSVVAADGAE